MMNETEPLTLYQLYLAPLNLHLNFFLLVLSVVLIAAAGNIINDYFDVKADRVNKPERLIIDKYIKRRWAIVFNWVFNAAGLLITIYLSFKLGNWLIAIIAFATINFLWFYSAVYKRKLIAGNILVAMMVGIVPIYVLIFNWPLDAYSNTSSAGAILGNWFVIEVVAIIAIVAFVINLLREIIKDMADIRGDLQISAKTVPITLGLKKTKIILLIIMLPLITLMAFYIYDIHFYSKLVPEAFEPAQIIFFNALILTSILLVMIAFSLLLTANRRKVYLRASNLLKLAMLFGMISPLFLC